jgi:GrpB-like predicted nucleotidyltransferase (UPF0157 family)
MTDLPAWATEAVQISDPDTTWPVEAARAVSHLKQQLGRWLLSEIEHVGSTAIPDLAAKPVIDLQALIASWAPVPQISQELAADDWHLVPPHLDQRPWRRFFVHVRDGRRHAHLHLMRPGAARWDEQLIFRDLLRSDRGLRERYATLKRNLATTDDDRERYSAAKTGFVRVALDSASDQRSD